MISGASLGRWELGEFRFSSFPLRWPEIRARLADYDVINVHGPAPTLSDAFFVLARTMRPGELAPVVYTHHSNIDLQYFRGPSAAYNRLHRRLVRSADRIITTSGDYQQMMLTPGGPTVSVIPWGVEHERFRSTRTPRQGGQGPLSVLFVGQMRPYKGITNLIDAVAGDPRFELSIAGSGPLAEGLQQRAASRGGWNVRFLGRVPDDKLERLYGDHDVIALPSTTTAEAYGLVLLEGMAAGCVPVASALPGVRDVAGPTGVLVPPRDTGSLRRALIDLAQDRAKLDRLRHASEARARSLGWDAVGAAYERTLLATVEDWHIRRAVTMLSSTWRPPTDRLQRLVQRFRASWASLLAFPSAHPRYAVAGWGRVRLGEFRQAVPEVSLHVARTRQPVLIDSRQPPNELGGFLRRRDVGSAMSVPVPMKPDILGVLNLSIGIEEDRRFTREDLDDLMEAVAS